MMRSEPGICNEDPQLQLRLDIEAGIGSSTGVGKPHSSMTHYHQQLVNQPSRGGGASLGISGGPGSPPPKPLVRYSSGSNLVGGIAGGGREKQGDCRCNVDDSLEFFSLLFLAGCRPTYCVLLQCVAFSVSVFLLRDPTTWVTSAALWSLWVGAADVASLGSIVLALKAEGAPLSTALFPPDSVRQPLAAECTMAVAYYALLYAAQTMGEAAAGLACYGQGGGPPDAVVYAGGHGLAGWGAALALILLPPLFALGEVSCYVSLLFPRCEKLLGSGAATVLVAVGWAVEAAFLPLQLDARYTAYRVMVALFRSWFTLHLYRTHRRVLPLIIAHWALAMVSACTAAAGSSSTAW